MQPAGKNWGAPFPFPNRACRERSRGAGAGPNHGPAPAGSARARWVRRALDAGPSATRSPDARGFPAKVPISLALRSVCRDNRIRHQTARRQPGRCCGFPADGMEIDVHFCQLEVDAPGCDVLDLTWPGPCSQGWAWASAQDCSCLFRGSTNDAYVPLHNGGTVHGFHCQEAR